MTVVSGYELEMKLSVMPKDACGDSACELNCWEVKVDLPCGGGHAPGSDR